MVLIEPVDAATRAEIVDLVHRHPQLFDNRSWELVASTYTDDAVIGTGGDAEPVDFASTARTGQVFFPHHTTDVVLHRVDGDTVRAWSKYLVVRPDGTAGSGDYQDTVVRTTDGWRIVERRVSRGNRPGTDPDGPSHRAFSIVSWIGDD